MDTGGMMSIISRSLATELNLKFHRTEPMCISGVGGESTGSDVFDVVKVNILTSKGSHSIEALVMDTVITRSMNLKPLSAQDYAVVQAHCGNHPHLTENTIVSPDLLISITETQDLLADSTTIILPSGYKLIQSILGPMITGRTNSRNSSIQYQNNILTSLTIQRSDDPVPPTADPPYTRVVEFIQSPLIDLTRYSTLNKAIRITGFILRFVQRTLKNSTNITLKQKYDSSFTSSSLLSAFERTRALQSLIRNHQSCHIKPHEVWIRNGLISQDDYGIWRANTRLDHAVIQAETPRLGFTVSCRFPGPLLETWLYTIMSIPWSTPGDLALHFHVDSLAHSWSLGFTLSCRFPGDSWRLDCTLRQSSLKL
ncbi:hypothetical protein PRIPAC_76645 [Pristionchus pacificus]|uniref:Uncharacterized protein n=1 Tax=Pristionchus pacificus TaxID=54126 RepID=A0A2A6CG09_PRIPA|nr:hypothetical protein PRIPAC_76645 [Pristionchus pacificus]|eukprot:PDM77079.1 hypothetical protein PRIPAC_42474 [Pristionchus pacificus]